MLVEVQVLILYIENFHMWVYTFIFVVTVEAHIVDFNLSVEEKGQK